MGQDLVAFYTGLPVTCNGRQIGVVESVVEHTDSATLNLRIDDEDAFGWLVADRPRLLSWGSMT